MTTSGDAPPPANPSGPTNDDAKDQRPATIRLQEVHERRARFLRFRAWLYLVLTAVLLGAAGWAVVEAPRLAQTDIEDARLVEWRVSMAALTERIAALREEMERLQERIAAERTKLDAVTQSIESTKPTDFFDVAFDADNDTVVAVGAEGAIWTSRRDSLEWTPRRSGTESDLNAVTISSDGEVAVAVGDGGTILVSRNFGRRWESSQVDTKKDFNDVAFGNTTSGNTVVAVGDDGIIQVSDDAGRRWRRSQSGTTSNIEAVAFVGDTSTAIAVGENGAILVSGDGGGSWTARSGLTAHDLNAVATHGITVIVAGDDGTILVSSDGGRLWTDHGTGKRRQHFWAVAIGAEGETAAAVGRDGVIRVSHGGFKLWSNRPSITKDRLNAVAVGADGRTAVAAGEDGTVLVTADGGTTWTRLDSRLPNELVALAIGDDIVVLAGEYSTLLRVESPDGRISGDAEIKILSSGQLTEQKLAELRAEKAAIQITLEDLDGQLKVGQTRLENEEARSEEEAARGRAIADKSTNSHTSWVFLFQTNSLRVAILVVLMFLSQHLISLARYDIRLAAYYLARRDALSLFMHETRLSWSSTEEFERLTSTLSPDGLDFWRPPRT